MNKLMQAAGLLQQIGARGSPDTLLAHITPREAALLKARGGSGRIDPNTGLPHFEDDGSDSTSYGGTQTGGSWAGANSYSEGINSVGAGGGHSDPGYTKKGYYSAAGDYDNSDPDGTRYYAYNRTIGGDIANALGFDPGGFGAMLGNGLISALGFVNPTLGQAGKVAQAYVGSQSIPSPADMDGNGASPNFIGRLTGSNLLSRLTSGSPVAMDSSQPADAPRKAQSGSSYKSGSSSRANNGRRKKPWIEE